MDEFVHPLTARYASRAMRELFSPKRRITLWRRLWWELMAAQRDLGLPIPPEALQQLAAHLEPTAAEMARAAELEKVTRHDVMAHIRTLAEVAPAAGPWLHLGATSCYVTDNADLIILREASQLVLRRGAAVVAALASWAAQHRELVCLGHTHFQPAQPTTVGKRACLWLQDLLVDLQHLEEEGSRLLLLGSKGTTGTQASFLELFGSREKVEALDRRIAQAFGFDGTYPVTGQTSPRKVEFYLVAPLSGLAQSAYRFATDIRLLARLGEVEEPQEATQVGSSAMPYKRNPMRCERMTGLARYLIELLGNLAWTAASQWLERTLDDSANRRLVLPEAFLAADALLILWHNVASGLVVNPAVIQRNLRQELPFLATEAILMHATAKGGNRQELHELLRQLSRKAAQAIKVEGQDNPLLALVAAEPRFQLSQEELESLLQPRRFAGCAADQVAHFLEAHVHPWLAAHGQGAEGGEVEV
ncbi:MAG: adenylosuccinate lyase [Thermoanaerobaculum sp.]|nr:adenylosuccinate lyase [Thermoanaerobaculum sp.]